MKTYYCNYSDLNYRENQINLCRFIEAEGIFDYVVPYTREWLEKQPFYSKNKQILDKERLAGYAIWKPYIILDLMSKIQNGDIVVYMDCGDVPTNVAINNHIKDYMQYHDQYLITTMIHPNYRYTKRDCFVLMKCDAPNYWNAVQLEDGFIALKRTEDNTKLLLEWLSFCEDERIVTDLPNTQGLPNFYDFVDHRHDQSVLSLIQVKYNLPTTNEIRQFVDFNRLHHKKGEPYSNGSAKWVAGFSNNPQ